MDWLSSVSMPYLPRSGPGVPDLRIPRRAESWRIARDAVGHPVERLVRQSLAVGLDRQTAGGRPAFRSGRGWTARSRRGRMARRGERSRGRSRASASSPEPPRSCPSSAAGSRRRATSRVRLLWWTSARTRADPSASPGRGAIGVLWDESIAATLFDAAQSTARTAGLPLISLPIKRQEEFGAAIQRAARERARGLLVLTSPLVVSSREPIARTAR